MIFTDLEIMELKGLILFYADAVKAVGTPEMIKIASVRINIAIDAVRKMETGRAS